MQSLNRRQFLAGSAGTVLGLGAGCGSGTSLPESFVGYLLLQESLGSNQTRSVMMRPEGGGRLVLPTRTDQFFLRSASPDAQLLVGSDYGTLALFSLAEQSTKLVTGCRELSGSAWSPDGTQLVCLSGGRSLPPTGWILKIYDKSSASVRDVAVLTSVGTPQMGWLDATTLVWATEEGTFRLQSDGTQQTKLSSLTCHTPSPKGQFLLVTQRNGAWSTLKRLEVATGTLTTLLDGIDPFPLYARWSRDGSSLLLTVALAGFFAMRIHTQTLAIEKFPIPPPPAGGLTEVAWSPDGQSFAYSRTQEQGAPGPLPTFLEIRGTIGSATFSGEAGIPVAWL